MRTEVWSTYGGWSYLPTYPTVATLDRGEIFKLADQPNDQVLINMKHVTPLQRGDKQFQCDNCSRKFIAQSMLYAHKRKTDCIDSQADTADGFGTADAVRMLDADPAKMKIDDPKPHFIDTTTKKIGGEA